MGASLRAPSKIGSFPCGFPSKPTRNPQHKANKRPRVYVWGSERRRVGQPSASMLSLFTHVGVSFFGGSPNLVVVPFGFHVKLKTGYQLSKKGVSASLHGKSADLGQIPGCKRLGCNFQGSMYIIYNIIHKNKCFGRNMSVCTTSFFEKKKHLNANAAVLFWKGNRSFCLLTQSPGWRTPGQAHLRAFPLRATGREAREIDRRIAEADRNRIGRAGDFPRIRSPFFLWEKASRFGGCLKVNPEKVQKKPKQF